MGSSHLADGLDDHESQRVSEHRAGRVILSQIHALECLFLRVEALSEVSHERLVADGDLIEHELARRPDPLADVAVTVQGNGQHWRVESGLLNPAREHAGRPATRAYGQDEKATGDSAERGGEIGVTEMGVCVAHQRFPGELRSNVANVL